MVDADSASDKVETGAMVVMLAELSVVGVGKVVCICKAVVVVLGSVADVGATINVVAAAGEVIGVECGKTAVVGRIEAAGEPCRLVVVIPMVVVVVMNANVAVE